MEPKRSVPVLVWVLLLAVLILAVWFLSLKPEVRQFLLRYILTCGFRWGG